MVRQIASCKLSDSFPCIVPSSITAGAYELANSCTSRLPVRCGGDGGLQRQFCFDTADTRGTISVCCSSLPRDYLLLVDTNQHKVKVFGTDGVLKLAFGGAGGLPGQLLNPVAVAYCSSTNQIVVAERAPAHQLQFFDVYGTFIHRCGGDILTHPRAISVDEEGCVAVVESRVMRVYIFAPTGMVRFSFSNPQWVFPTDIAVNKQRVYVCDNRSHCVWVHTYQGHVVGRVGDSQSIKFPVAVSITADDNILVTSNHDRLTVAEFDDTGTENSVHCCSVGKLGVQGVAVLKNKLVAVLTSNFTVNVYRVQ